MRQKHIGKLIIGHININSIRNKFEALKSMIHENLDIFVVSETKIDESFPLNQFKIEGFSKPFRFNRTNKGGGIIIYIRSNIPSKIIKNNLPKNIEGLFVEINLHNKKWVIFGGYNPNKAIISDFLSHVGSSLDILIRNYDNFLLLGDFNSEMKDEKMKEFCNIYNLQNLIKEPTCYKSFLNPTSIDVILTNKSSSFQSSCTIETGLSDHHKMTVTILKTYFKKLKPSIVKYRCYKYFEEFSFKTELKQNLKTKKDNMKYDDFKNVFMSVLNKHAPTKEKIIRGNNAPFMNKILSKAFMERSKLKNKCNKFPTNENWKIYKKQRNYCVNLLKKEKKEYYNNLNIKKFNDNKTFWKTIKPFFSDKQKDFQKDFILIDNDEIISNDKLVAEKMNNYFMDVIDSLDIEPFIKIDEGESNSNSIEDIIDMYSNHPSILKIKEHITINEKFSFKETTKNEIQDNIKLLNTKKITVDGDIPSKMLILTNEISSEIITNIYNESKEIQRFPYSLKLADVKPIHKKSEKTNKENYRPISLLPTISKLFERDMYSQIINYIDKHLSPFLFGFRKGHSTEVCLNVMLEQWKKALDDKKYVGAILTDLSKAFDCLNHKLLIAKLEAYGFEKKALLYIFDYLSERNQRTKVNSSYSSWREIKYGVPQGSILGPLFFNIFLNDIFLFVDKTKMANYADDNTPYAIESNFENLINVLENETAILLNWFRINEMKSNEDKCKLIILNREGDKIKIGEENITGTKSVKLLGVTIDNKLNFDEHVHKICKKASQKLHALARISKYLDKNKLRVIMKTFIESQFNYCPTTWMFHSRKLNNRINLLHERALRIVYKDNQLTFRDLLILDKSFCVHHKNLQKLATEMFKIKNSISPVLMLNLFPSIENAYNFRNQRCWESHYVRTVGYGTETLLFRGKKTWQLLPESIKKIKSLAEFKIKVKNWLPEGCTCRLCKTYINNVGFID